uniref:THAP-type domain-containing protein n=1 Tax=Calidris pygmaea TaxID=425635 RepID=A0A8C3JVG6_9CHAR
RPPPAFPLRDAARLRQWLAQMRQENWVPTRHQHLCSDHFEPSCFQYRWGVRYLRPDAVPTIFPLGPTVSALPSAPRRAPSPQKHLEEARKHPSPPAKRDLEASTSSPYSPPYSCSAAPIAPHSSSPPIAPIYAPLWPLVTLYSPYSCSAAPIAPIHPT